MRRKLILIWTFPLTFLAAGTLLIVVSSFNDYNVSYLELISMSMGSCAAIGAGSFVSHVPVALALNKRLPADRLWLMILLSLAATVATFSLSGLASPTLEEVLDPTQDSLFVSHFLLVLLVPGMVMSLIHVLVAFLPRSPTKARSATGT